MWRLKRNISRPINGDKFETHVVQHLFNFCTFEDIQLKLERYREEKHDLCTKMVQFFFIQYDWYNGLAPRFSRKDPKFNSPRILDWSEIGVCVLKNKGLDYV